MSQKIIQAAQRYAQARDRAKEIQAELRKSINACLLVAGMEQLGEQTQTRGGRLHTCIAEATEGYADEGSGDQGGIQQLVQEYGCPHCRRTLELLSERKAARRARGAASATLVRLGRAVPEAAAISPAKATDSPGLPKALRPQARVVFHSPLRGRSYLTPAGAARAHAKVALLAKPFMCIDDLYTEDGTARLDRLAARFERELRRRERTRRGK